MFVRPTSGCIVPLTAVSGADFMFFFYDLPFTTAADKYLSHRGLETDFFLNMGGPYAKLIYSSPHGLKMSNTLSLAVLR